MPQGFRVIVPIERDKNGLAYEIIDAKTRKEAEAQSSNGKNSVGIVESYDWRLRVNR